MKIEVRWNRIALSSPSSSRNFIKITFPRILFGKLLSLMLKHNNKPAKQHYWTSPGTFILKWERMLTAWKLLSGFWPFLELAFSFSPPLSRDLEPLKNIPIKYDSKCFFFFWQILMQ